MTSAETQQLCLDLLHADTEEEVVQILTRAGYWDTTSAWRLYGDRDTNQSPIGNQQDRPEAALVEKIINSVDARLLNECLVAGIDPESPSAPQSITEAVTRFFKLPGRLSEWLKKDRTAMADGITLAATGIRPPESGNPCFTISDAGEGQTPERMPETFLSLDKKNKQRVPFVQGKFNMGGTGVLPFCGERKLQLVLTRRNPAILNGKFAHPSDDQWGFTIVRREVPADRPRATVYKYLAPVGAEEKPGGGGVLRFAAASLPIFPEEDQPYARHATWGALVKLYEFQVTGRSNILLKSGLLRRLDLLLPDIALPIRLHECRGFSGKKGSFDTPLAGISVRLDEDRAENLEEGFPSSSPLVAGGEEMAVTIYAFKKERASTYRTNKEGIIFTFNGQTHGNLPIDFFGRKRAGKLNYIADSIIVVVDCSKFGVLAYENLFMNSRDRLRAGKLKDEIESALEELLRQNELLRALKERRKREAIGERLSDNKPLESILQTVIKNSPSLAALFLAGTRLSNAFKTQKAIDTEVQYKGKRFPTFFRLKDQPASGEVRKNCPINFRARLTFETDAENEYFSRAIESGTFELVHTVDGAEVGVKNYVGPNLQNGKATLSLRLPANTAVGDELHFIARITDPSRTDPFESPFFVSVRPEADAGGGSGGRSGTREKHKNGQREEPSGIEIPQPILVYAETWEKQAPPFNKHTALRVREDQTDEDAKDTYDFYVNMDNAHLLAELKEFPNEPEVTKTRFQVALVLIGLALLYDHIQRGKTTPENENDNELGIEQRIEEVTAAIAPVLLPAIRSLGSLEVDEPAVGDSGEAA